MRGGAYTRGLIRGATQVSRKRWAYLRRGLYAGEKGGGGGVYRLRNTVYNYSWGWRSIKLAGSWYIVKL